MAMDCALEDLSDVDHAHVPFVLLLLKALRHYRIGVEDALPKTAEQKALFQNYLRSMRRNENELNFDEALKFAYLCYSEYKVPDDVKVILSSATRDTEFGLVCLALAEFVEKNGCLPLAGRLPDFTASTDTYLTLRRHYSEKAEGDVQAVLAILQKLNASPSEDLVRTMCKNAHTLEAIRFRSVQQEWDSPETVEDDEEETMFSWYAGFRALNRFREEKQRYPCVGDVDSLASGKDSSVDVLRELCRYEGCEQHATSSFIGGVAAQEAVKLITHIFVPLNHTLVYNGLFGKTTLLTL